ncbi:hypothetical protein HK405_013696, partial [Cladochytrium tenue]
VFRITTFGESHCRSVGVVIDGCPPGMPLDAELDVQPLLRRRRPGQSDLTTPRNEEDLVTILSGTEKGYTLGTPIAMSVNNKDQRPHDYGDMDRFPRPSHADYTYLEKYGIKASSGGGRSSARETIGRVAAAAVAEKYLRLAHGIEIVAFVSSVGAVSCEPMDDFYPSLEDGDDAAAAAEKERAWRRKWEAWWDTLATVTRADVDASVPVRCPDAPAAARMRNRIAAARDAQDSVGGTVVCVVRGLPPGLGEPAFDKLEAVLAHAMLSIPASKSFEVGSGLRATTIPGHVHNDPFVDAEDADEDAVMADGSGGADGEHQHHQQPTKRPRPAPSSSAAAAGAASSSSSPLTAAAAPRAPRRLRTATNFSGGIQGGITNGAPLYFRVGFKPVATIGRPQATAAYAGGPAGTLEAKGRHDPCVLPRAVPIVEAMAALVVM